MGYWSLWGGRGIKKVIFNHEVHHLVYWVVNILSLSLWACLPLLSHSRLYARCIQQRCDIQQCMFLWQPVKSPIGNKADSTSRCFNEKNDLNYKRFYGGWALYCNVLYSVIGPEEELLCSSCVYSSFHSAPEASRNPLCMCVCVCAPHTCLLASAHAYPHLQCPEFDHLNQRVSQTISTSDGEK